MRFAPATSSLFFRGSEEVWAYDIESKNTNMFFPGHIVDKKENAADS